METIENNETSRVLPEEEEFEKCYKCGKPADFISECFIKKISQKDIRFFCGDCIPKLLKMENLILLSMKKIDNYDFRQMIIEQIFTPEKALESFNRSRGPNFEGEKTEAFWSIETEEITVLKRESLHDDTFHLIVFRIHCDALYNSLSWEDLDFDNVIEDYITSKELERFKILMEGNYWANKMGDDY